MMRLLLFAAGLAALAVQVELASVGTTPFPCPEDGLQPDPENCQCFYDCANGKPFHECCAKELMFDSVAKLCNYEDQVDCGDRPKPTSGPTTSGPTVPTTSIPATTTGTEVSPPTGITKGTTSGPAPKLPKLVLGMYILLADNADEHEGWHDNDDWEPLLHPYQQQGSNVLFFTFIDPTNMTVPLAFRKLAATRGSGEEGAVPADTLIIFAVGGYAYSLDPNPWDWLTSQEKAEAMAVQVAKWRDDYGCDGIDLDIEEGAGGQKAAGPNLVHFITKLKSLQPGMLVTQPTYGWPQVKAENDVINASWNKGGTSNGLADTIGLMVYDGTQALKYVNNYAHGDPWGPIKVDVPTHRILVGSKGSASSATISKLATESVSRDLLGIMVWYCSVINGPVYEFDWDCTNYQESMDGYVEAMNYFNEQMNS